MKTFHPCYAFIAAIPTISVSAFVHPAVSVASLQHLHQTANDDEEASMQQYSAFATDTIFLSTAIGIWFIGSLATGQVANAADTDYTNTHDLCTGASSLLVTTDDDGMSVSNYIRQVFQSPMVGNAPGTPAKPIPTDPKYDTREARNRAYDDAFQQDARDRDAYYGQMAMRKRQEANQNVQQYRETLGLDGTGDVRMRVGEERVQGMASLRDLKADYLSSQEDDSSQITTETPAE